MAVPESLDAFDQDLALLPESLPELSPDAHLDLAIANAGRPATIFAAADDALARPERLVYGRSWAFDFEQGQFVRWGAAPAETTGQATLRTWIEKAMRTQRFAHVIFSDDYGMDDVEIVGNQFSSAALARLGDTITDTLTFHDRVQSVTNIRARRSSADDDALEIAFDVQTVDAELNFDFTVLG